MMVVKEIRNAMKCLNLMCEDLNDAHNDYDVDTMAENRYKQEIIDAVNDFNTSQSTWCAKFYKTKKGWVIKYE